MNRSRNPVSSGLRKILYGVVCIIRTFRNIRVVDVIRIVIMRDLGSSKEIGYLAKGGVGRIRQVMARFSAEDKDW